MTASMSGSMVLQRLTMRDLPAIASWFEDPDTRRYLGGLEWPGGDARPCGAVDRDRLPRRAAERRGPLPRAG